MKTTIKVKINGNETEMPENSTIAQTLDILNIKGNMLVVEKNTSIVDKGDFGSTRVKEGDSLEIVGFFGGG